MYFPSDNVEMKQITTGHRTQEQNEIRGAYVKGVEKLAMLCLQGDS